MKLKTPEFLQLYGTVHRQAFPQPFRFIRMCFNRRGLNRLFSIFCPDSNRLSTVEIRAFSVSVFQNVLCIRCRRQNKSFLIQQFFKNVGEVWASSPHLRSKSNCMINCNKNLRENRKNRNCLQKSKGYNDRTRFQGQLRFPRQAGDGPQPCRTGFRWYF